jgi:hypothetical protein
MNVIRNMVLAIQDRGKNPTKANEAFDEFFQLFYVDMLQLARFICCAPQIKEPDEFAKDVLNDALKEFLIDADKFNPDLYTDEKTLLSGILIWMKFLILKQYKLSRDTYFGGNFKNVVYLRKRFDYPDQDSTQELSEERAVKNKRLKDYLFKTQLLRNEITKLSEENYLILITTFSYDGYIPRKVLDGLSKRTGLSRDTIRQRKSRTLKRLEKVMLDRYLKNI